MSQVCSVDCRMRPNRVGLPRVRVWAARDLYSGRSTRRGRGGTWMTWYSKCAKSERPTRNSLIMTFRQFIGTSKSKKRQAAGESYHSPRAVQGGPCRLPLEPEDSDV